MTRYAADALLVQRLESEELATQTEQNAEVGDDVEFAASVDDEIPTLSQLESQLVEEEDQPESTEMSKGDYTFRVGDAVWAKMKGLPAWPGKIEKSKKVTQLTLRCKTVRMIEMTTMPWIEL